MRQLSPVGDRVIVRPDPTGEKTLESGIVLPDGVDESRAAVAGEVIAAGPGKRADNGNVIKHEATCGARVLFSRHAGQTIELDGEHLVALSAGEILAVIE